MSLSCKWNFSDKINLSLFWRWSFIIKKASYWNLVTKNLVVYFLKFNIELSLKFRCQIILSPFRHRNFSVNFLTFHFKNGIKISFIFWSTHNLTVHGLVSVWPHEAMGPWPPTQDHLTRQPHRHHYPCRGLVPRLQPP